MRRATLAIATAIELLAGPRPVLLAQAASLTPPRQVWAAQTGSKEIMLVWKRAPDAEGYRVSPVGNTPRRSLPTGTLAKNVDHVSISLFSPFAASYSYEISAVYSGGRLSRKVQSNTVTPLVVQPGRADAPPAQVEASETEPGIVTITWSKVPSATAYQIGRSVAPNGFKPLCQVCSTATKYVDRKVTAGAKHVYTVTALTPKGPTGRTQSNPVTPTGQTSDTVEADSAESVAAGPPDPPGNVTVLAVTGHSFELSWDRAEGATGYEISRRINNGEPRVLATTTSTTRYVDNQASADPKGALSYGVTALNSNGRSEEVVATVHDSTSADAGSKAAIDLKAAKKSANSVLLTWGWGGAGGLVRGHRYALRRRIGGGLPSLLATIDGRMSSFVDQLREGIAGQLAYFLEDFDGKGAASNPAFVTIDVAGIDSAKARSDSAGLLPKAPSDVKAAIIGPDVIRIEWNLNAIGEAALEMVSPPVKVVNIYRGTVGRALSLIGTVQRTVGSFVDHLPSGWATGGPVFYAVEAVNEKGASEKVSVTVDPNKALAIDSTGSKEAAGGGKGPATGGGGKGLVGSPAAVLTGPNTVTLSWNGVQGVTYEVQRRIGTTVEIVARVFGIVAPIIDQLPGGTAITHLVYTIIATDSKGASETASVGIAPGKGLVDTTSTSDGGLDSLPAGRGKTRSRTGTDSLGPVGKP
jgi:hypothetical protein